MEHKKWYGGGDKVQGLGGGDDEAQGREQLWQCSTIEKSMVVVTEFKEINSGGDVVAKVKLWWHKGRDSCWKRNVKTNLH